jgi:hypothetical protein
MQPSPFQQQGLRPQAHVRRGSRTARVTPQKDGRFKSVVISRCRFLDRPTRQAAASSREGHDDEAGFAAEPTIILTLELAPAHA